MDFLSRDVLYPLIDERAEYCVSLYMPTHRSGPEIQQDPIRLKNLLREAEEQMLHHGRRRSDARALLAPARRLLGDDQFWQHQSDGLALLLSPNTFRAYRLPYEFVELGVVADRFHLKPLLTLLSGDGRFYILALSQKRVRLLMGTRHSVSEMSLDSVPTSLADALAGEQRERDLRFRVAGHGGAMFHGHGSGSDETEHKKDLLRYFQRLDKGIQDLVCVNRAPLILAGVDYLLPIYRDANTCAELVDEGIVGNPDNLSDAELHRRAWAIVAPRFTRAQELAAAQYRELACTDRAATDLETIVPAAEHGRINHLFVAVGVQRWGRFDRSSGSVTRHEEREPGDQDLLDLAAVQTLAHAGDVFAVKADEIPERKADASLAAVFRY
jgi:hypothetical protein